MQTAEIIAIGDELLSGETVDTNSSFLDGVLEGIGYRIERHTTVGDEEQAIAEAFEAASRRAKIVISTGGLGPTDDDVTLAALARALGCALIRHEPTIEAIKERFRAFGREMTPNNERQAMVPERGEVIENRSGTAPSFTTQLHGATVFLLPGVPREVRWLIANQILPRIPKTGVEICRRTLKVIGFGESRLEHSIRDVVKAHREVRWGYRAIGIETHIKLLARGEGALSKVEAAESALRSLLGDRVFGAGEDRIEVVVGKILAAQGSTVAVAESCTGGLIAKILTDVPGASSYVLGAIVSYADQIKVGLLGVPEGDISSNGAVSEIVARAMAENVRARFGATYGLSATGIAGPTGGTPEKPVGTVWIAGSAEGRTTARLLRFPGDRDWVRTAAACSAIDLLRLFALGKA